MDTTRPDLLTAAERSLQAAHARDRAGWLGLFTSDARVEDPVGSRPHQGPTQIDRFYDTFIAPRSITAHRDFDVVCGTVVVRDLELEVAMGPTVIMRIPTFIRYDLREVDGQWRVSALRAYWELPAMVGQFLRNGLAALPAALQLSKSLLRNQRVRGTLGFAAGFRRAGYRDKKLVDAFLGAIARGDTAAAVGKLSSGAAVTFGDDETVSIDELIDHLDGADWSKLIGAGSTVAASVVSDHGRGVLFAEVTRRAHQIIRIRYFAERSA